MDRRSLLKLTSIAAAGAVAAFALPRGAQSQAAKGLWGVWDSAFAKARFVLLSHVLTQEIPIWKGFPPSTKFSRGTGRLDDKSVYGPFTYEKLGLETSGYSLATDQFGTQLDPPAHWH